MKHSHITHEKKLVACMATETERDHGWVALSAMTVRAESTRPSQKRGFSSLVLGCALSLLSSLPRSTQPLSLHHASPAGPPATALPLATNTLHAEKTKQSERRHHRPWRRHRACNDGRGAPADSHREVWVELLSFAGRERSVSVMDDMTPVLAAAGLCCVRARVGVSVRVI